MSPKNGDEGDKPKDRSDIGAGEGGDNPKSAGGDDVGELAESLQKAKMDFSFDFTAEDDDDEDSDSDDESDSDEEEEEEDAGNAEAADEVMAMMPPYMVARVEKLRDLNLNRDKIMEKYLEERTALEQKFLALCQPLYERRRDIVRGKLDEEIEGEEATAKVSAAAAAALDDIAAGGDETAAAAASAARERQERREPGVPQFWICAMSHMETVAELITERDVDCLEHCTDITCTDHKDGMGFTLKFHFGENDYFTNDVLTKQYEIPNLLLEDEPILKLVTGCQIEWKQGRCLTHREVQKRQRSKSGRKAGQIRTVTKKERVESFFHFFSPPKMPSAEEMDEEMAEDLEEAFDHDYDVAQAFRSHIIPKAVMWFTGEALEEEVSVDGEEGEGEEAE